MRKFFRLGVAALLAVSGLIVVAESSNAVDGPLDIVDCDPAADGDNGLVPGGPINTPEVTVPVVGAVVGASANCADPLRTLVFVGDAVISNGVNAAGTGTGAAGGTFNFEGRCLMVNWQTLAASSVPTGCTFGGTQGSYFDPHNPNAIGHGIFGPLTEADPHFIGTDHSAVHGPHAPASPLGWVPAGQASCVNSSGGDGGLTGETAATANFTSNGVGGGTEVWNSSFSWQNSLDNLRGTIQRSGDTEVHIFDAKIEANADPAPAVTRPSGNLDPGGFGVVQDAFDLTAAGCLQKTLGGGANVGLNWILIVGTATWDLTVPEILP